MSPYSEKIEGTVCTITVEGDFTQSSTAGIRQTLTDAVKSGITTIRIDMAEVNHIDSPSIGVLVATHNSLKAVDGKLIIYRVKPHITELFSFLQLNKRFEVNPA
jgi:anti-anti-sigma factor